MSMQSLFLGLSDFWAKQGCYLAPTYDLEVGAGTMTPDTFSAFWAGSRGG